VSRRPVLMGNWKMYKTSAEARTFAEVLGRQSSDLSADIDYGIFAPFTSLFVLKTMMATQVRLGAQNIYFETEGAYTGEISAPMVAEFGCKYVLVGHSERRSVFHEPSEWMAKKVRQTVDFGMVPVLCVGENLADREAGQTLAIVNQQVIEGLSLLTAEEVTSVIIAYEPVWAIGSGKTATATDAQEVASAIRQTVATQFSATSADAVRILYGGSVKPENIATFLGQADIDGALVGGASLQPDSFVQMAVAIREAYVS
jgi:triosephosphate isomerase (TIM)